MLTEGLRQEVTADIIHTTLPSPEAVQYQITKSATVADMARANGGLYENYAIPADSFARAVAFAINQPDDVDINEIQFRPTRQDF